MVALDEYAGAGGVMSSTQLEAVAIVPLGLLETSELAQPHTPPPRVNAATHYLLAQSDASRRVIESRLAGLLRVAGITIAVQRFPWELLEPTHVAAMTRAVADHSAPSTARATVVALRGVLQACRVLRYIDGDRWWSLDESLAKVRGKREPRGRALTVAEVSKLYRIAGVRDRAMLALLFGAGLRRAEAAAVAARDVAAEASVVRVIGKGDKQRTVPLAPWARETLAAFIAGDGQERRPGVPLLGITGGGVYYVLGQLCARANVVHCSPHDGRRTWISELLDVADTAIVARLAGHSSTEQTREYDRRDERAGVDAVNRLRDVR